MSPIATIHVTIIEFVTLNKPRSIKRRVRRQAMVNFRTLGSQSHRGAGKSKNEQNPQGREDALTTTGGRGEAGLENVIAHDRKWQSNEGLKLIISTGELFVRGHIRTVSLRTLQARSNNAGKRVARTL